MIIFTLQTPKWLEHGLKAQTDYKKLNRKMPVFPMEWIVMQNYENLDISKFSNLNFRQKVSNIFMQLKSAIDWLLTEEIETRVSFETFLDLNKFNYIIEEIDKDDNKENFDCDLCTYYGFLSQLCCNNCRTKGCLVHNIQCKCLPTNFSVRYRYSIKVRLD